MKSYMIDPSQSGWLRLGGNVVKVVAYFRDGHTEEMSNIEFLILSPRKKRGLVRIDCYTDEEIGDEAEKFQG